MKIRQKLILFLAITFGVLFICIGKVQAADINVSPSSGVVGTQVTISGHEFTPYLQLVMAQWDSDPLGISNNQFDGDGRYISSTVQVPASASVGQHKITVTVSAGALMYGPKHYWFSYIVPRAWAADGSSAETFFTVTAPPVTPPVETPIANTNTSPVNSNTQSSNANTNTKTTAQSSSNSNQATAETPPETINTNTNEQTVQTEPTNEVKEGAEMCYFPWWLWLVLILITAVNLALFWVRYWKKKPKESNQKN